MVYMGKYLPICESAEIAWLCDKIKLGTYLHS